VLRTDIGHSLHRDRVTANGNLLETKVLAAAHEDVADDSFVTYFQPSLVRLRDRVLAVFSEDETQNCWVPLSCRGEVRLLGMHVEEANAQPFLITGDALWGDPRVAASPNEALVIWEKSPGLRYTLLSADAPEQPSAEGFIKTITSHPPRGVRRHELRRRRASIQPGQLRTLKIVRVTDASCAANDEPETMRITVDPFPTVSVPESELRIARGATATLSVSSADAEDHAWYEGEPGDTSRPVGANAATFTTPPLQRSTRYWVRVSNRCGTADSAAIAVTVPAPKGRAVRH
jgi:hypothetical protein